MTEIFKKQHRFILCNSCAAMLRKSWFWWLCKGLGRTGGHDTVPVRSAFEMHPTRQLVTCDRGMAQPELRNVRTIVRGIGAFATSGSSGPCQCQCTMADSQGGSFRRGTVCKRLAAQILEGWIRLQFLQMCFAHAYLFLISYWFALKSCC